MFDISPELRAAAAVAAAKRARRRRAFGAPTARPGRAQRALSEPLGRVWRADMTERAGRRSDRVAPIISSSVVSLCSPLARPHNRQNRLRVYAGFVGYIDGVKYPSFYPSFGGTRRQFWRHYCRQSGVKKGYFYPYIPHTNPIYTPLKSRAGSASSSCHSATLAQAAPRGLAALALVAP